MGYTTYFTGQFDVTPPLTTEHNAILTAFNDARHEPGEVLAEELYTYYCQWIPNEDGTAIVWDEGEKFYEYIPWIEYLIAAFLKPWGYTLNGEMSWSGEEDGDMGLIRITDNEVKVLNAVITYE